MPQKLTEMKALFAQEAGKYGVLPLDNRAFARAITPRPSATAGKTVFTYTGVNIGIPNGNAPNILNKSFAITADVQVPQGGGTGMIVTQGGKWGGYGLYLLKGRPVFMYNLLALLKPRWANDDAPPLSPGKHTVSFEFTYDGPGIAKGGTGTLKVDGGLIRSMHIPNTIPFLMPPDETFDVGDDTRTGVNDLDYAVPFPFDGKIEKLTFAMGPSQLNEGDNKTVQEGVAKAHD